MLPVRKQRKRLLYWHKRSNSGQTKVFNHYLNMPQALPLGQLSQCHLQSHNLRQNGEREKTISAVFLGARWCLSRAGGILWIMQAGEVGRAEGKGKGKCCSTAVDLRETSASDRNLEKSPQAHRFLWAVSQTHLCLGRLRAKHCSGSRGMGCAPAI